MICPRCGAESAAPAGRCAGCGSPADASAFAATDLQTAFPEPRDPVVERDPDTSGDPHVASAITSPEDATFLPHARQVSSTVATGPLAIGEKFGPRYHIVRLLGIGGMGAVYQAWDAELDLVVAIKVIRPEATRDPFVARAIERRFKQELVLARQVTDKHVVRIHDLGEIDGIKYITMSYIDGEDLSTVLKKAGKLPVPAALKIMRQVAQGLRAAHDAGVVHRDLKPANIMIEGSNAIIMDFGIARSAWGTMPMAMVGSLPVGVRHLANAAHHTSAGTIVGTIAYMAPEQARGEAVDARADIYSFGLIASDMLVGPRLHAIPHGAIEEMQRRMTEPPPRLRTIDSTIPEALDRIVARCVEPDPLTRFQTTAELVTDLHRLSNSGTPLPLVRRLTPRMIAGTALLVLALLAGTYYATRRALEPVKQPDPVTVLIADFQNNTRDSSFHRTLEPMIRRALEGAGFISAYDRSRLVGTVGVQAPERLDEVAAREIAAKQGLGVVLTGSIDGQGGSYALSMKALRVLTGNVIVAGQQRGLSKGEVLQAGTRLAAAVRTALGDETPESDQIFAMTSVSATSLDAVQHYVAGMEANSNNKFEAAQRSFAKALELDQKFGVVYTSLAAALRNLGRPEEGEKYLTESLRHLDGMTERERYSTRGYYYLATRDYQLCVREYGELIARFAADVVGRNQRALCMSHLRQMRSAADEMQYVVNLLPSRTLFRTNLALYSTYAGDFATAEKEARALPPDQEYATLALAFAQVGQSQFPEAIETYKKLGTISAFGASLAASGLADVALTQGRFSDAVKILGDGAAHDLTTKASGRAAAKYAAIAYAELLRGRKPAAIEAAEQAVGNSKAVKILFLAGRVFVEAEEIARARPLIDRLASELQAEPQAHAKILESEIALKNGAARQAITLLAEAEKLLDTWIGHFALGRAYLAADAFIQADSEFDRCIKRRGEAVSLFADEEPTYGYFPAVYYYQGRVRERLKNEGFAESYRRYLGFRGQSKEDPLVSEIGGRAGR